MSDVLRRMVSVNDATSVSGKKFVKAKNHLSLRVNIGNQSQNTTSRPVFNRSNSGGAIEEVVQCGICLERLSHPRMLPCQHTFCLSCLQTHVTARNLKFNNGDSHKSPKLHNDIKSLSCPVCQQKVDLPEGLGSIIKLPKNLHIDSLLRVLDGKTSPKSPGTTLDYRCVNCQTVSSRQEQVCQHCIQIFCNVCWNIHLSELESKLTVLSKQLADSEARLLHKADNFDKRCDRLEEKITEAAEKKIAEIRRNEIKALKEVDSIKKEGHIASDILTDCIRKLKNQIDSRKENKSLNNQRVTTYMNLHRETSKLLEQINFFGEARVTFNPDNFTLEQCSEAVYNGEEDAHAHDTTSNSVANPFESVESMAKHYKSRSFTPKLLWKKCPRPAGMGIPPWDDTKLYVTATDTHEVLILDMNKFKIVDKLCDNSMACPTSIAFSLPRKEIFVVDKWNQCLHVFSQDGAYVRNLCAQKLRSPEGVAVGPNGELWVCDTGNDKVIMIDPQTGEKLKTIGVQNGFTQLNFPTSVAVYGNNVIVMDSGNNRVKTFDSNGDLISEFGYIGSNPGQFKSAEVLAVDQLGFIFVGDAGNARIQVFKSDGTLVKIFGSRGGFGWVSGILVTPNLDIIATDIKMRSLRIF